MKNCICIINAEELRLNPDWIDELANELKQKEQEYNYNFTQISKLSYYRRIMTKNVECKYYRKAIK